MAVFDDLELTKFDGWRMPVIDLEIQAAQKFEIHEYLRLIGGNIELHGRTLYKFTAQAIFHAGGKEQPPLWPDTLNALRRRFEREAVGSLVIPHIGRVTAVIVDWKERRQGNIRSGVDATITLLEHSQNKFLTATVTGANAKNLAAKASNFEGITDDIPNKPSIFDQIVNAANDLLVIRDTVALHSELIVGKIEVITGLIREADATVAMFQDPLNHEILQALHDLWAATVDLVTSPGRESTEPSYYVLDSTMTISEVSTRIYGTTERAMDLLGLNYIEDALRIPQGTRILYIPD